MLLGADFLRSHRVLVAHSQREMYFTYAGRHRLPGAEVLRLCDAICPRQSEPKADSGR